MRLAYVYILTGGTNFSASQCRGILDALNLGLNIKIKDIPAPTSSAWIRWLPSHAQVAVGGDYFRFGDREIIKDIEKFEDGSILLIASGKHTISTAVEAKKLFPQKVFTVMIGHPLSWDYSLFDKVIVSNFEAWIHSLYPLPRNAHETEGFVNRVSYQHLVSARSQSEKIMQHLDHPTLVLYLGSPTSWCPYSVKQVTEDAAEICHQALSEGALGQVVVVYSEDTIDSVKEFYDADKRLDKWTGDFIYLLAWADLMVVTADAIPECNEVATAGKPVFTIGEDSCTPTYASVYNFLRARGAVRTFTLENLLQGALGWRYKPLGSASDAAGIISKSLAEKVPTVPKAWFRH